jgi:hypothetical protein
MKIQKQCKNCGIDFFVPKYRENTAIYCSRKCLGSHRISILHSVNIPRIKGQKPHNFKAVSKHCLFCNQEFFISPSRIGRTKFCKRECHSNYSKNTDAKKSYKKSGYKHTHRVIAENFLGRLLNKDEVVHHIDGDKHNNAESNLVVMNRIDHMRLHSKYRFDPAPFELFSHIRITSSSSLA